MKFSHKGLFKILKQGNVALRAVVFLSLLFVLSGALVFLYYAKDLPRPEKFTEIAFAEPSRIYDHTGEVLLYEIFGEQKREVIPLDQISPFLTQAVIATEDANFYNHSGIDLKGIARAVLTNFKLRAPAQGGSTISQQLIRNSLLTRKKTVERKIQEVVLTLELERRYSKSAILEFYLNQIPFGSSAYGIAAASKMYLGKSPLELSVAESAALAAMIQAPTYYSPNGTHMDELLERKDYVLSRMESLGFLSKEAADTARTEVIAFIPPSENIKAPHFSLYIADLLTQRYGEEFLRIHGLRVTTSLNWELQQLAEKSVNDFAKINASYNAHNASLVAMDPNTGGILAMVGSRDWFGKPYPQGCTSGLDCAFDPKVNVATRFPGRQPGSAFKPFAYITAFTKGTTDQTVVVDELTNFGEWGGKEYIPQNYDLKFRGPVTLRQSLAQSLNIPSIKVLLYLAGLKDSILMAREMGLSTIKEDPSNYGPSLVLGGGEVRLLDLVSAYGVFATEGTRIPPLPILKIQDDKGTTLEENRSEPIRVVSAEYARMISSVLADNEARTPIFGANSVLYFPDRTVSAKTGTTQDFRDGWVVGYTKDIVAGVWVGNSDNSPINKEPGSSVAGPIWKRFLQGAFRELKL